MLYMAVDINDRDLKQMAEVIKRLHPDSAIVLFQDPLLAFQYAFQHEVQVAYVNVRLNRISGFELTRMLLTTIGHPQVILIDNGEKGRENALRIGAAGFLIKPVTAEKLLLSESMEW